jgi:CRP-like cAMP-binding protein
MVKSTDHAIHNRILLALPGSIRDSLLAAASQVELQRRQVLHRSNDVVERIYFIDRGLISLVQEMRDGRAVEVGARGIEAITTPEALIDSPSAIFVNVVQIPCTAWSIDRRTLREMVDRHAILRELIHGYLHVSTLQIGQTAACNRLHALEERCARWLLIAHDSAGSDNFALTHEFLAMMLGAPRSGVTNVYDLMRNAGYIDYTRGQVTILDRAGLKDAACECYASIHNAFDHLFAWSARDGAKR